MSATNRGTVKVDHDFYPTPKWVTEAIAHKINWTQVHMAEEPCRGSGAIVQALEPWWYIGGGWKCYEIREGFDYFDSPNTPCDLTITNPPYTTAAEFLKLSLKRSRCVVYLLRINFLGSAERKDFLSANRPTHLYTLTKRPSFVDVCDGYAKPTRIKGCGKVFQKADAVKRCNDCGGRVKAGTDATEYAWICWDRGNVMRDEPGIYFL